MSRKGLTPANTTSEVPKLAKKVARYIKLQIPAVKANERAGMAVDFQHQM